MTERYKDVIGGDVERNVGKELYETRVKELDRYHIVDF